MATYVQIQEWVKYNYAYIPATRWIAHVKSECGLPMRKAPNRKGVERVEPCPPDKRESIRAALCHFGMI